MNDTAPRPVPWPVKAVLLVLLLGSLAAIFLVNPGEAQGQVSTYPEFTPSAQQRALLRAAGPVECGPPIRLNFESAEGLRAWLWPQPAFSDPSTNTFSPAWGALLRGCVVVPTGQNAGELIQDTLAGVGGGVTVSCREQGFAGGHFVESLANFLTVYGSGSPTVGQWFQIKCHHPCGEVWCLDNGLAAQALCIRLGGDISTPWAPSDATKGWRQDDWLGSLLARRSRCRHPEEAKICLHFGLERCPWAGASPPPAPPPPPPPPPADCEPRETSRWAAKCVALGHPDLAECETWTRENSQSRTVAKLLMVVCPEEEPPPPPTDPPPVETCTPGTRCSWPGGSKFIPDEGSTGGLEIDVVCSRVECPGEGP